MVTKVRSASHQYDSRIYSSLDNSSPQFQGGGLVAELQSVVADYPEWDYKKLIAEGSNACTSMTATRNGFVKGSIAPSLSRNAAAVFISPPGLIYQSGFAEYIVDYYGLVNGLPSGRHSQRLFGNPWGGNLTLPSADPLVLSAADNQANMVFRSKAMKHIRLLSGGVAIGELKEAIHLIRNPAMAIRGGVRDYLNRLNSRRFRNSYRASSRVSRRRLLSDSWLEFSFGWSPLISDVQDGARLVSRLVNNYNERKLITAVGYGRKTIPGNDNVSTSGGNLYFNRRKEVRAYEALVIYRGLVSTDPENTFGGFNASVLGSAGLNLLDFVPTIYELIPFSFLVDYFTNIGSIIDAACHFETGHRWLNKTTVELSTSHWSSLEMGYSFGPNIKIGRESRIPGSRVIKLSRRIVRSPNVVLSLPSFELHLPFSNLQWINIAALATSLRGARQNLRI